MHPYFLGTGTASLRAACAKGPFSMEARDVGRGVIHLGNDANCVGLAPPPTNGQGCLPCASTRSMSLI